MILIVEFWVGFLSVHSCGKKIAFERELRKFCFLKTDVSVMIVIVEFWVHWQNSYATVLQHFHFCFWCFGWIHAVTVPLSNLDCVDSVEKKNQISSFQFKFINPLIPKLIIHLKGRWEIDSSLLSPLYFVDSLGQQTQSPRLALPSRKGNTVAILHIKQTRDKWLHI